MIRIRYACGVALASFSFWGGGCASRATDTIPMAVVLQPPAAARPAGPVAGATPLSQLRAHPAFEQRVEEILAILNGGGEPARTFSAAFLAQVPAERIAAMTKNMRDTYGRAEGVSRVDLETPFSGLVVFGLERSQLELRIAVQPTPPHQVRGLLMTQPGR